MIKIKISFEQKFFYTMIVLTAVTILTTAIIFKQSVLNIAPLMISLIVGYLSSKASKYSLLIGSFNCIIYCIVYFILGVYSAALSALLVDGPFQFFSFIKWNKRGYKNTTTFRKTKLKFWLVLLPIALALYFTLVYFLKTQNSKFVYVDVLLTVSSLITYVLMFLSYKEYSLISLITAPISLIHSILILTLDRAHITFVVYSIYSLICGIKRFISVQKFYKEQQEANCENIK